MDEKEYLNRRKELTDKLIELGKEYWKSGLFWQGDWREMGIPESNSGLEDFRRAFDTDVFMMGTGRGVVLPDKMICGRCGKEEKREIHVGEFGASVYQPPRLQGLCNDCSIQELEGYVERARRLVDKLRELQKRERALRRAYAKAVKVAAEVGFEMEHIEVVVEKMYREKGFYRRDWWNSGIYSKLQDAPRTRDAYGVAKSRDEILKNAITKTSGVNLGS